MEWKTKLLVWASVHGLTVMIVLVLSLVIVRAFATQLSDSSAPVQDGNCQ